MQLLDPLAEQLSDFGITMTPPDEQADDQQADLRLSRGSSTQEYQAKIVNQARATQLAAAQASDQRPGLVYASYISPRTADSLRRSGIQYLDVAGNAWIEFGDVLIDVRGRPRPANLPQNQPRAGQLLSAARAQVALALITWPKLWEATRRTLARAAGVSIGQAHNTVTQLDELGYHDDQVPRGRVALLDLWTAEFPIGLARRLTLGTFHGKTDSVSPVDSSDRIYVSGEQAVGDLLRQATLTLYVEKLDPRLPIVNRWRADGPPNITIRRKFWQAPNETDEYTAVTDVTPWPLVYADLAVSEDPRVKEAAEEWRQRHVRSTQCS